MIFNDRVKQKTNTVNTDDYSLGDAVEGFETFADSFSDGDITSYGCTDGVDYEIGHGTVASSGLLLQRTTIIRSSNGDNAVSWSSGLKDIFCTLSSALVPTYNTTSPSTTENPAFVGAEWFDVAAGIIYICIDNSVDNNIWKSSAGLTYSEAEELSIAMAIALG